MQEKMQKDCRGKCNNFTLLTDRLAEERKIVCDAVYKLTRELLSFGFKTVSIEDVENVIKQFDEGEL